MLNIPISPKPENPVMLDRALAHIQDALIDNIGWLNHAFGRAQRLVTNREHKPYYYPGVYIGRNEYLNVLPGQDIGNRTFFVVGDPHTIAFNPRQYNSIKSPFSLICWYDLASIYNDSKERNTEDVKRQILRVLSNLTMPSGTRIELAKIYEQAENIYREYSLKEIDTQYLMQPYAGVRFDGYIIYKEECL